MTAKVSKTVEDYPIDPKAEKEKPVHTPTIYVSPPVEETHEAGGIAFTEVWGRYEPQEGAVKTFKISVTGRGRTAKEAFANLVDFITDSKMSPEEFRKETHLSLIQFVPGQKATPPTTGGMVQTAQAAGAVVTSVTPAAPAAPVTPATPAAVKPAAPTAPATTVSGEPVSGGIFDIVSLDITPRADGKVDLKYFGNDKKQPRNQYPDIIWVTTPDKAIERMSNIAGFTAEHMSRAGSFQFICKLFWNYSTNTNSKGNPYKNVSHFEPLS